MITYQTKKQYHNKKTKAKMSQHWMFSSIVVVKTNVIDMIHNGNDSKHYDKVI